MSDTNILIKELLLMQRSKGPKVQREVAFDIISVITIWELFNNSYLNIHINKKTYYMSTKFIGLGFSIYIIRKYF